jgi:ribonuclease J
MDANAGNGPLRLIPLGGLGEFGLNAFVISWGGAHLLLDAGMLFPPAEMPGVDSIVPDFQFLAQGGLLGILLTHGHEDHIGALSFALDVAPAPVFGSRLTLGFVKNRLAERKVHADLRLLEAGKAVELGPFRIHPIRVAHSVLDSLALAIETPEGVILASGDFKMDPEAAPGERTDAAALAEWGKKGVLVLLSDSTGVEQKGRTEGEESLRPAFEEVFGKTEGRVLVSCFATSIPRIQRVAEWGIAHGRKVAFVGRRMLDNARVAEDLGLLRLPEGTRFEPSLDRDLPPDRMLLFVSGSQGEPLSALSAVSLGEHRDVSVGPGDTAVLSARAIPGNERTVSRLISNLYRRSCEVVHPGTARVHVSGHGSEQDLADLLSLVRPRHFVPIHGEYRMLAQHARLAHRTGLPTEGIHVLEDGDVLALSEGRARLESRIPAGRVLLDRSAGVEVEDVVVRDRRHLSADGIVVPVVVLDRRTGRLEMAPEIVTRGLVEGPSLLEDAGRLVAETIESRRADEADVSLTRERVRMELRRFFKKRTQQRPMVIPVVMEV